MTKSNTNNTLINENLPKYCGHFTNKHLSTINLILKIGMILKKLKIINWFSQWTKKKYYLTIIINFIIFKIKILTIQKLSYTNKYTKRTFGKTDDIFILIKKKVNWRLNNIFFYLSYLINELITKGLIQEIIKNNLSKNFFDFTKQIYVRDINSNNSWNNYELYVKK